MRDLIVSISMSMLFICQFGVTYCKQCVKHDNCICVFDDDSGTIDLSTLSKIDGDPLFKDYPATMDTSLYSYNPCGPFTEITCVDIAVCQYSPYTTIGYDVGLPDTVSFNFDGLNVIATYESKDGMRHSIVTLVCDPDATTPVLDVVGETGYAQYSMTLTAAAACPVGSASSAAGSSGISPGSVVIIICVALLAVYVAVGLAFNKFKKGANGKELVPNIEFWTNVPGLIRDGCKYCLSLVCRRRSAYAAV